MSGLCVRTMCALSFSQRGRQPEEVTGSPRDTKIPGSNIRGFHTCARYWDRTSEGKNFPSARGTNKSFLAEGISPRRSLVHPGYTKSPDLASEDSILVRDTGIEPVTSSVSGKRATAAPIALNIMMLCEVRTGFEPAYTALQAAA